MESSPRHKFDELFVACERLSTHMFQPVVDVLSLRDLETPAPSYASVFADWKDGADEAIIEMIGQLPEEDRESFDMGKIVAYRALEKFVAKAGAVGWAAQTAEERRLIAEQVLNRPQIPQRTAAWYAQGKQVLTASEFAKLLGSPRSVSQLIQSKVPSMSPSQTNRLACMTCEMGPFDWGIRFEPVVKQILEAKWGVKIAEAGRILHPTDTHIAASPDGIILEAKDPARVGRLLEIKCPVSRVIGEGVPFDYWCQMQVQMEVTGIDECEYVEVKLDSIQGTNTDLSGADGFVWLLQNHTTYAMQYAYTEAEMAVLIDQGYEVVETIPWRLNKMYAVTLTRDRGWFLSTVEAREEFWKGVEEARLAPLQHTPRVIVTKEAACLIVGE